MKLLCRTVTVFLALFFSTTLLAASDPIIIDVRSPQEFSTGHIQGALNMPHTKIGDLIEKQPIEKDAPIIVYCRSGRRSGIAQGALRQLGFTAVSNGGGFKDMQEKYPVQTE